MNKTILKEYLNDQIAGLSPEKQMVEIDKIIEYVEKYKSNTLTKIRKKYTYCYTCKKYHLTKLYKIEESDVKSSCCVYSDCGYGDNDEYAECIHHIKEKICPKCGNRQKISSVMTWRGPSFTRDGRKGCF